MTTKLKSLLVLEALFYGMSSALTTGVLFIYVVSIGGGVGGISLIVGVAGVTKLLIHLILYKFPKILLTKAKTNFVIQHAIDRILFLFIPFTQDVGVIALIYACAAATPTTAFTNLAIFGSLSEDEIKDVTAKRTAALGFSSIIGYAIAIFLLAFMPANVKFLYIFVLGASIGLLATLTVSMMDLSHLKKVEIPKSIKQPERLFSTSTYFVAIFAGNYLLTIVWVPYVMDYLKGPDYLVISMYLATMLTSVVASVICKGWPFKKLRYNVGLDAATPILVLVTPFAIIQPLLSSFSSFTYTASNFIGHFLFAGYNRWLGAIKSSMLIVIIMCLANVLISPMSTLVNGNYFYLFLIVFGIKLIAFILSTTTIPEVAAIPEEEALTNSYLMYNKTLGGYYASLRFSKETLLLVARLLSLTVSFIALYIIYRLLYILMH